LLKTNASFHAHRFSFASTNKVINIWMTAHVAKPPMKSAVLFGWEDRNGLVPVYFKGQMSSDF
jgi:hypothetical protein